METRDASLWCDKCDCWMADECKNLNPENYNFVVLQWNIRSLMTNQNEMKQLLTKLERKNTPVDVLLLCETFLTEDNTKLIKVPNCSLYTTNRKAVKGGGTAILIHNGITHKRRKDLETMLERECESTCIEVTTKSGKHNIMGSMYQVPNMDGSHLQSHIREINQRIKSKRGRKELVLGMDHNFDLLKTSEHSKTRYFLDEILDNGLIPTITRLTKITRGSTTLINNIFISSILQKSFESRNLNDNKLSMIQDDLKSIDWNGLLRSDDCSENFDQFHSAVMNSMDTIAPLKKVRIAWKWKFTEPWMDKSIEKASNKCKQLHKISIDTNASEEDKVKYTKYRDVYNKLKRNSRMEYYSDKCLAYKNNIKKLWELMNSITEKTKHSGSIILYIMMNGVKIFNRDKIANHFRDFYSKLGSNLAKNIQQGMHSIDHYILKIPRIIKSLVTSSTNFKEIEK